MKLVVQRVRQARVEVENSSHRAEIGAGLLILLGVERGDSLKQVEWLVEKVATLRVFEDENGKMGRSLLEIQGQALLVSQFTLAGRCDKGRRPSFDSAASPDEARRLYESFGRTLEAQGVAKVETGVFGARMAVSLVNDGPVTFILESKK